MEAPSAHFHLGVHACDNQKSRRVRENHAEAEEEEEERDDGRTDGRSLLWVMDAFSTHPYMTSTKFVDYLTTSSPLLTHFVYCLSANLEYILTPPPPSVRKSCMEAPMENAESGWRRRREGSTRSITNAFRPADSLATH